MIRLNDVPGMFRSLEKFADGAEKMATRELQTPAETLLDEVQSQLSRPGHGRIYYGRGRLGSKRHQASAAGEPPAPDTRQLLESARIERDGETRRVVVDGPAAARLEFGARDLSPRPFMRPSLSVARNRMGQAFAARLRKGR